MSASDVDIAFDADWDAPDTDWNWPEGLCNDFGDCTRCGEPLDYCQGHGVLG